MNKRGGDLVVLGALLGGVVAGVFLAERARTGSRPSATRRLAAQTPLPAPIALPRRPVTYEALRVRPKRRWKTLVACVGSSVAFAGAVMVALAVASPEVTALAAPGFAYPGTTAVVSYAFAGFGTASYRFDARSGPQSGGLSARQGAIAVPIAQRDADRDVIVVVRAAGLFGSDVRTARIAVLPRPHPTVVHVPSNGVHIDGLSLSATSVASGAAVGVRYRSNATAGNVVLRDARGGLWLSKPLSTTGFTELRVPVTERDTPFNVALQVRRNGAQIENSVALMVVGTSAPAVPSTTPRRAVAPAVTLDIPAVARSGALVVTSAGAGRIATVVELSGKDGLELQRATPRADGTTELRMPVVTAPRSYLVSVSYRKGDGRETSFHWIRVLP